MLDLLVTFWNSTGFRTLFDPTTWNTLVFGSVSVTVPGQLIMLIIACTFLYLAVKKGYEPYLLLPIAFGMLLANLPLAGLMDEGGLLYWLYKGVK
ncbi:MAG: sodium ion-translocating decarboxylase subunit beta, partial [Romboutsia sp.]